MTFRRRGIELFKDWEPSEWFEPDNDRLLVTTSWQDCFVVSPGPAEDDGTTLLIDSEFMPQNLREIPRIVRNCRTLPLEWDVTQYPWNIFIFDGDMTHDGPLIEMLAGGVGWTMTILSELTIDTIMPISRSDISRRDLSLTMEGLTFGEPVINQNAIYDEALRIS